MMIFILQLLVSVAGTVLFAVFGQYPAGFVGVLVIIAVFFAIALGFFIVFFMLLVVFLLLIEKTDTKSAWKHAVYVDVGVYLFNILLRVYVKTTGKDNIPKTNRFIIYSNHIEYTDPFYIKTAFKGKPLAYIAKAEVFKIPVIKSVLFGSGCIALSRDIDRRGLEAVHQSIQAVENGQPLGVFPEGTRSYSNTMADFKPGSFKLALRAKADIVPICLYNMHGIFRKGRLGIHKGYLHILPSLRYEEYKDLDSRAISDLVKERIQEQLDKFKATIPDNDLREVREGRK
ncbi:MAG: lysophospholipid acyltransferase family protein [Candidatus Izemoplasmatales bacterium]|jgi:1-acyl-sn-glycerol-3-phosphate acyltransferase